MQRAAAGALRTLAFKNEENKNQIVECGALPTLIQMLQADDAGIHYEAVGVIGNLVHSSIYIKRQVGSQPCQPSGTLHSTGLAACESKVGLTGSLMCNPKRTDVVQVIGELLPGIEVHLVCACKACRHMVQTMPSGVLSRQGGGCRFWRRVRCSR